MIRCLTLLPLLMLTACQASPGPVFPVVHPPVVWPPPPDPPRIQLIGELRGEASLGRKPTGWQVLREALAGPEPPVEFSHPAAVAVNPPRVYVADTGLGVVHILNLETREYAVARGSEDDPLQIPIDLVVQPDKSIVVIDRGRACFDILDAAGTHQRTSRCETLAAPVSAVAPTSTANAFVVDVATHAIYELSDWSSVVSQVGARGSDPGQFNYPSGIAWHSDVGFVVADAMNFRVQVLAPTGSPVAFGRKGNAAGDFSRPRDVAVDSDGHIYVLDNQFENVQIFDAAGRLLLAFGGGGDRPGQLSLPSGITIDDQDRIWIADSGNRRVQVFQYLSEDAL